MTLGAMFPDTPPRRRITFSEASLRAIAGGWKNQTRRLAVRASPSNHRERKESVWTRAKPGDLLLAARSPFLPIRCLLRVTGVRRERLHAITDGDAMGEGVKLLTNSAGYAYTADLNDPELYADDAVSAFRLLWERVHGPGAWEANPEVVVLTFEHARQDGVRQSTRGAATRGRDEVPHV